VGAEQRLDWAAVKAEFATEVLDGASPPSDESDSPVLDFDAILAGADESVSVSIERGRAYVDRLGAGLASCPTGHAFVNGRHLDLDDVRFLS